MHLLPLWALVACSRESFQLRGEFEGLRSYTHVLCFHTFVLNNLYLKRDINNEVEKEGCLFYFVESHISLASLFEKYVNSCVMLLLLAHKHTHTDILRLFSDFVIPLF